MTEFVLTNNSFEFLDKVFRQVCGTTVDTKFAVSYACIYMETEKSGFSKRQHCKRLMWFRYIHLGRRA